MNNAKTDDNSRQASIKAAEEGMEDILEKIRRDQTEATGIHDYDQSTWHDADDERPEIEDMPHYQQNNGIPEHPLLKNNNQSLTGKAIDNPVESALANEDDPEQRKAKELRYQHRLKLQQRLQQQHTHSAMIRPSGPTGSR